MPSSRLPFSERWRTFLKTSAFKFGVDIRRALPRQGQVVSLRPRTASMGHVLLSDTLYPFLLKGGEPIPHDHAIPWRTLQIAKIFLSLHYCVDVIDYHNELFVPEKDYCIFIDMYINLERIAPLVKNHCIKIFYIQIAHWLFHNRAEYNRHEALLQRRSISLKPMRQLIPHRAIEHADCAILHGNDFVRQTYTYAKKPFYGVPMAAPVLYPWPHDKAWEACRTHFLWFGNHGFIHKGLDLVLDAFVEMPEYHLTICGPLQREQDFVVAFDKELYHTPNIHTVGWVDTTSHAFIDITTRCIGIIYPACSEGGSGSVITCMHAGLIPIISHEAGVDVHDFGVLLRSCSLNDIKEAIRLVASLSPQQLAERARQAWEYVRAQHTRERFSKAFRDVISTIVREHSLVE